MTRWVDTLQVCDLALAIEGPPGWMQGLRRLWPGWLQEGQTTEWLVSLDVGPDAGAADALFEARPHFRGGLCELRAAGFAGSIDPGRGRAWLEAHPRASAGDLELFVRTCLALQAFEGGQLLFHAAGVVHKGWGYGLFGQSGSGKTTATQFSPGDVILHDDLVLVRPDGRRWALAATPFGGRRAAEPRQAPLRALLRLVHAEQDRLEAIGAGAALGELVANSPVVNAHEAWLPRLLAWWHTVLEEVPVRALNLRKGPSFWEVIDAEFR
jgi:hypothetical protein